MTEEIIEEEEIEEEGVEDTVPVEEGSESEEGEEETPTPGEKDTETPEWKETVSNLEREISGLKKGISAERGKRQHVEGKLTQLSEIFTEARSAKRTPEPEKKLDKIPVQFDDEGQPYVPPDVIEKLTSSEIVKLKNELAAIKGHMHQSSQQFSAQRALDNAVSPEDTAIYNTVKSAYANVDKLLTDYLAVTGHGPLRNLDEALDVIERAGIDKRFEADFPGLDLEATIEAFMSPRKLRKAISIAKMSQNSKPNDPVKPSETLGNINKLGASSHVGRHGSPGGDSLTLDQIANLSQKDFDSLSEAQMKKIDRILEGQEG